MNKAKQATILLLLADAISRKENHTKRDYIAHPELNLKDRVTPEKFQELIKDPRTSLNEVGLIAKVAPDFANVFLHDDGTYNFFKSSKKFLKENNIKPKEFSYKLEHAIPKDTDFLQ